MKKSVYLILVYLLGIGVANAAVIGNDGSGFSGFTTNGINTLNGATYAPSGYNSVALATSTDYVGYGGWTQNSTSSFTFDSGTFDLDGFTTAGAWGSHTLTIEGLIGATVVESTTFHVTTSASFFSIDWKGLTSFTITNPGTDFVDDPTLNGSIHQYALNDIIVDANAVPIPSAVWLFGSGLIGLISVARRKKAQ